MESLLLASDSPDLKHVLSHGKGTVCLGLHPEF